jgi:dihydrofolate reductase
MQAPGGPGEDEDGGFAHGGWSVNYCDEKMGEVMSELMSSPLDLVLGRRTYDIFAAHRPHASADCTIPSGLKLVDSTVSTTGVVIGTYEPAGAIVTGSFALD